MGVDRKRTLGRPDALLHDPRWVVLPGQRVQLVHGRRTSPGQLRGKIPPDVARPRSMRDHWLSLRGGFGVKIASQIKSVRRSHKLGVLGENCGWGSLSFCVGSSINTDKDRGYSSPHRQRNFSPLMAQTTIRTAVSRSRPTSLPLSDSNIASQEVNALFRFLFYLMISAPRNPVPESSRCPAS
jgi:hypothetical protein